MRGKSYKAAIAILASIALLIAGCGQPGTSTTDGGAVTDVGFALTDADPGAVGLETVKVTVNEDALIDKIELYIDGTKVTEVTTTSLKPQALEYTLTFDSAKLGDDGQPLWKNGDHTLKVVVTDKQGNSISKQQVVPFNNADYVRGIIISQDDNPKAPVTAPDQLASTNVEWFGNGDVKVTVDIVNYTDSNYTFSGTGFPFTLNASGGVGGPTVAGYKLDAVLPVSGSCGSISTPPYGSGCFDTAAPAAVPATNEPSIVIPLAANTGFEDDGTLEVRDTGGAVKVSRALGIDNKAPALSGTLTVEAWHPLWAAVNAAANSPVSTYDTTLSSATGNLTWNSETLFRGAGYIDNGVSKWDCTVTYKVEFVDTGLNATPVDLPGKNPGVCHPAGVKVADIGLANFSPYDVYIVGAVDALGNSVSANTKVGTYTPKDFTIQIDADLVHVSNQNAPAGDITTKLQLNPGAITITGGLGVTNLKIDTFLQEGNILIDLPLAAANLSLSGGSSAQTSFNLFIAAGASNYSYIFYNASYAVIAYDPFTWNYGVLLLGDKLTPTSHPNSDGDVPTLSVTVNNPFPVAGGATLNLNGTASDPGGSGVFYINEPVASTGPYSVSLGLEYGEAAGNRFAALPFIWLAPVIGTAFSSTGIVVPEHEGNINVLIFARDRYFNYSVITTDLQVK